MNPNSMPWKKIKQGVWILDLTVPQPQLYHIYSIHSRVYNKSQLEMWVGLLALFSNEWTWTGTGGRM